MSADKGSTDRSVVTRRCLTAAEEDPGALLEVVAPDDDEIVALIVSVIECCLSIDGDWSKCCCFEGGG